MESFLITFGTRLAKLGFGGDLLTKPSTEVFKNGNRN